MPRYGCVKKASLEWSERRYTHRGSELGEEEFENRGLYSFFTLQLSCFYILK